MGNHRAAQQYIKIVDIPAHVNSIYKRQNHASGVIKPTGEHSYTLHGQEITAAEFNDIFPVVMPRQNVNRFGEQKDGRQVEKYSGTKPRY